MTEKAAIEALKLINWKNVHSLYNWEEMMEVRDMAIKALEKQIPKKPNEKLGLYECPICNSGVGFRVGFRSDEVCYEGFNYCSNCGQAIDRGEKE